MEKVMAKIKNDIVNRGKDQKKIGDSIAVKTSMMSKYLSGIHEMPAVKFIHLLDIMEYSEPLKTSFIMDYVREIKSKTKKKEYLHELMEWSSNQNRIDILEGISDRVDREKFLEKDRDVYRLLMKRNNQMIDGIDFFIELEKCKQTDKLQSSTRVLLSLATLYSLTDMRQSTDAVQELATRIIAFINQEPNDYINASYTFRTLEVLANSYLNNNMLKEAREICEKIISMEREEEFPLPVISAYSILAQSYAFSDYENSISLIRNAIERFDRRQFQNHAMKELSLQSTHDFIKVFNGKYDSLYLSSESEKAFCYAKIGRKKDSLEILNNIQRKRGKLSGHQYYYKYLNTSDIEDKVNSINEFIKQGSIFYAQLPNIYS